MMTLAGLQRRVNRLVAQHPVLSNYLASPSWLRIGLVIDRVLALDYPDAYAAVEAVRGQLAAERFMCQYDVHTLLYRALYPYLDARVALADALTKI